MTQDEIIEMARQYNIPVELTFHPAVKKLVHEVAKHIEARYMQLFLDPENQPTQFGTATQEYREKEVKEVQDLLIDLAHHVRTKHLYGMEVQKMLEKEAAIRARGTEA